MNITIKEWKITNSLSDIFYHVCIDDEPVGTPISKQQAEFLVEWLSTMIKERIDNE